MSLLESKDLALWFSTPRDLTESLDAIAKVEALLSCNSCKKKMEKPVTLWSCDHVFCQDCIEDMEDKCAVCKMPAWAEDQCENKTMADISRLCSSIKGILSDYMAKSEPFPKDTDAPEGSGIVPDDADRGAGVSTMTAEGDQPLGNATSVAEETDSVMPGTADLPKEKPFKTVPGIKGTKVVEVNGSKHVRGTNVPDAKKKSKKTTRRRSKIKFAPMLPFPAVPADTEDTSQCTGEEVPNITKNTDESCVTPVKATARKKDDMKPFKIANNENDFPTPPAKRKKYSSGYNTPKNSARRLSSPGGRHAPFRTPGSAKKNKKGETPLHVAAIKGKIEDVRKLVAEDVDINSKDNAGWTPLHEACHHGHLEVVQALLEAGASVNMPGYDNETPITDALISGRLNVVQLLLEHGADPYLRNSYGKSAMSYAETDEMKSILTKFSKSPTRIESLHVKKALDSAPEAIVISYSSSVSKSSIRSCARILNARTEMDSALSATHLIVGSHLDGKCPRTLKYLQAISRGAWIVQVDWLEACSAFGSWVKEQSFEVVGSKDDILNDGPKRSRINKFSQCPGILSGYHFYLSGNFKPPSLTKEQLSEIIRLADGEMLTREPKPDSDSVQTCSKVPYHAHSDAPQYYYTHYIVYDSTQDKPTRTVRRGKVCTVPSTWVLDCVSQFHLCEIPE